ncbi:SMP-30/gluconolactonase/LRE family protein [Sulfurisphaera ohwakuensis]|uniref:SMP-30/gluconolactonase/LRE family protein n=1 Tax=Sulfurisphaera ohwakuensis TaxID=69656 RepID=A0A650CIF8_SULOH|nr:SMP-30/gluconolactonase/LRE family protein [Sulfurisphaera ohwakuensis]MBB5253769.1 sugar lactone lactonase YvrE [Sulfurisphaera ohwakuensis]QGR17553.1 SMP-30/gluconolactonase/LRE family protein [Sulfurisphaera ohwakuensis]
MKKVTDFKGKLFEGPIWVKDTLYFVDIIRGEIHSIKENQHEVIRLNSYVSSIQPRKKGGLIATSGKGFYIIENNTVKLLYEVENWDERNRFNDGKCDAMGRYWVGTMNLEEKYPTGALYVLDLNMKLRKILDGVTISNGLAWSLDNKKFYYIDSPTKKIYVFNFDLMKGEISNRNTLIDLSSYPGVPDGMTIDSEGMLWVALYGGGRVLRVTEGRVLEEIKVPASHVTSVTFGDSDLKTLYITTANDEENGGYIYSERVGVKGVETYYCEF